MTALLSTGGCAVIVASVEETEQCTDDPEPPEQPEEVVWTFEDLKGKFADAIRNGDLPESEIVGYRVGANDGPLCALVMHRRTRSVQLYRLDTRTWKPIRIV
jgi:hypothetical protein